jgi:hypothetical protein
LDEDSDLLYPAVEQELAKYLAAAEQSDARSMASVAGRVMEMCGPVRIAPVLLDIASRYRAQRMALQTALDRKSLVLDSLLSAPRRLAKALGLIHEKSEAGEEVTWAVLQGPPHQAARFHADVSPRDVCDDCPDKPVWVWLAESPDGLAVVGRIEPPPLLQAGVEREMVFEGLVHEEGETDAK